SINKAQIELNWQPKYDLISGLKDSWENDYLITRQDKLEVDFSVDDEILNAG
ncbi:MAG: 3-beta hydroxysteroid dehydrogenase, partial [Dolichospermum sp.]